MTEHQRKLRREGLVRAREIMAGYPSHGDRQNDLSDLLTDLRHLASEENLDWAGALSDAEYNWRTERGEGSK